MKQLDIKETKPDAPDCILLIEELDAHLRPHYPVENRHGYSVQKLLDQAVSFFIVRVEGQPAGCGGIQFYSGEYGELKRMYVRPGFRGNGIGRFMLDHFAEISLAQGIQVLRLETGVYQKEAIGLYESWGFRRCDPFGDYQAAPLSLFYEKGIGARELNP